jgi:hypothetical protein
MDTTGHRPTFMSSRPMGRETSIAALPLSIARDRGPAPVRDDEHLDRRGRARYGWSMSRSRVLVAVAATACVAALALVGRTTWLDTEGSTPPDSPSPSPPPVPCEDIDAWDACEAAPHCSPMHLSVSEEHSGPIWACVAP